MSEGRGDGSPGRQVFHPKTVAAIVVAGIVAFVLFLVLMAYAGGTSGGRDGRANALSGSAVGFKGLVRLIELGGGKTVMVRSAGQRDSEDLLVVTLEPQLKPEAIRALLEQRQNRPTLLILPKWQVAQDQQKPGWVNLVGPLPAEATQPLTMAVGGGGVDQRARPRRLATGTGILDGVAVPLPRTIQTIYSPDLTPVLAAAPDEGLISRRADAPHFLLSDPDLLNNQGLKDPASARAALALLTELNSTGARTVMFELALNGFEQQPSALKLAFEPPFLPLTLALFVAALLAGLHGAFRFGPEAEEARAIAFGKAALVENSAALFKIAGREHRTGGAYADLIREAAAHDSGAHLALRDAELDAYLDRVSPAEGPSFSELAARARAAETRFDLVAAARALFQWKKDLIK
jgi:hypothetical protein